MAATICICFGLLFLTAKSNQICGLEEKYSVSLIDANGLPIGVESAELDSKRDAILFSTRSSNEIIRIRNSNGQILNQPYIADVPHTRASKVIGDLFYVTSDNVIQVYDLSDGDNPVRLADITPESTRTDHIYNGLCATSDNRYLYVTDPGFKFGPTGGPTVTGGVWKIDLFDAEYETTAVIELGTEIQPNGCIVDNDDNLLISSRLDVEVDPPTAASSIYLYNDELDKPIRLNLAGLSVGIDGLVVDKDDNLFITENVTGQKEALVINWADVVDDALNSIDQGEELSMFTFDVIEITIDAPGDTGYDAKKNYLLVPCMNPQSETNFAVYKIKNCD